MNIRSLAPLALLLSAGCVQAATYLVAPGGSDSASGSPSAPWATISHAADQVGPGDVVQVAPGTYPEQVYVTSSGTSAAPIRFEALGDPGDAEASDDVTVEAFRLLGDHIEVSGFRVRTIDCGDGDSYGIEARGTGFLIEGNDIYEMPDGGIQTSVGSSNGVIRNNRLERNVQSGIELHGDGHLVEGNEIIHPLERHPVSACNNGGDDANGVTFFGTNHVLRGNLIYDIDYSDPDVLDAHADCFQTYGSWYAEEPINSDILVEDNVCEALTYQVEDENGNGFYIQDVTRLTIRNNVFLTYGGLGASEDVVDLQVINNTFVSAMDIGGVADTHRGVDLWHQTVTGGVIRNNIFVDFRGGPFYIGSQVTNTIADHNLMYWSDGVDRVESWWGFQCDQDDNLCADPQLVDPKPADPAALDFRIAADSPAIDAGSSSVAVSDDIDGVARPQGAAFDLGAHELPAGPIPPIAALAVDVTDGEIPLTVRFEDRSAGSPTGWAWDFGDGTTSTAQHPSHTYAVAGSYTVTLTVTNDLGVDSATLAEPIQAREPSLDRPLLDDDFESGLGAWTTSDLAEWYTGAPNNDGHAAQLRRRGAMETSVSTIGYDLIQVHFALGAKSLDKGTESVVAEWSDGSGWQELTRISDGDEDSQLHAYSFALPATAAHNPSLGLRFVLHGSGGRDYAYIDDVLITGQVAEPPTTPPVAGFSVDATAGEAPLSVNFADASTDATSWSWDFGDGASSTSPSPSHTYASPGIYDVSLSVANDHGSDTETKAALISVSEPPPVLPVASFTTSASGGEAPVTIDFASTSTDADSLGWDFGDGATSTATNPSHTYPAPGSYAVVLTATNGDGSDTATTTITVTEPPPALDIYYVSTTGSDASTGSETAPLATIQEALDRAQPGNTVIVQSGTYNEIVRFPRSGRADAWITLMAQPGHAVTIDGAGLSIPDYWEGVVTIADVSYIRVQGLRVEHSGYTGIIANRTSFVEILNNQTYDTYLSGIGIWRSSDALVDGNTVELAVNGGEQESITVSISSNVVVSNNEVSNDGAGTDGGEGIDIKDGSSNVVVRGNTIHDLDELGIYVDSWDSDTSDILIEDNIVHNCNNHGIAIAAERGGRVDRVTIRNNLLYRNGRMGITIADWDAGYAHPMDDILIVNNTAVENGLGTGWGAGIAVLNGEASGIVIRNNLVAGNEYAQILDESGGAGITADHNLLWGDSGSGDDVVGTNPVQADPMLVDAANDNFRLQVGSPAIDAGSATDAPATDLDGNARPLGAGIDIGAYEHQQGPVPPIAALSADPTSGEIPLVVQFADASTGEPTTWLWSFGDGATSTEQNPSHGYAAAGSYDVTLTVTNDEGSSSVTETGLIEASEPGTGLTLIDDGFESGLAWTTSGDAALFTGSPNNDGTSLQLLKKGQAEIAVSTEGLGSLQLGFAMGAKSLDNADEYLAMRWWDGAQWQELVRIANGSANENGQLNPYQLVLPAAAEDRADFALRVRLYGSGLKDYGWLDDVLLTAEPLGPPVVPTASFDASPLSGPAPLLVSFADTSADRPSGWLWDFGDGTTSSERNPVHDYLAPGTYDVTLTVTNDAGSDSVTMAGLVSVDAPLPDQEIWFEDFSAGLGGWYTERDIQVVDGVATLTGNNVWANRSGVSTAGFDNIRLIVDMGAARLEADESFILYWKDADGSWQQAHAIHDGDPEEDGQLHRITIELPAGAADNASFGIALGQWSADSSDVGFIDNISLRGTPR